MWKWMQLWEKKYNSSSKNVCLHMNDLLVKADATLKCGMKWIIYINDRFWLFVIWKYMKWHTWLTNSYECAWNHSD